MLREAYKYNRNSLGVFESLHYHLSMIDLIDEYPVVKGLKGRLFSKVWAWKILLMQREWFEDFGLGRSFYA